MKPKKNTGNKNSKLPPISESSKKQKHQEGVSGTSESAGGSRDGNVGHQSSTSGGKGDRQV
ncbi:hypothetical protein [Chryseosolibacter indicus]|uniref:YuzL family protein n=1 Tax=Chryseosolibacter indicus TaxID=2782351 RepID=A0ABS5VM40_9BACT|nr:hypothetical protein [Chryseosolibacter indicus]MBT1701842.1 hypothetical protein [Chryseosolibacter indicus]